MTGQRERTVRCRRQFVMVHMRVAAVVIVATGLAPPALAGPSNDYMLQCRGCHGPDGAGAPGAAPSFRGQVGRFLSVPGGREYLIRVPGTAQSELDDAHTAALLNWLVHEFSRNEVPADFVPYSAAEVGRWRRSPLLDVWTTRRELVQAIEGQVSRPAQAGQ